MMQRRRVLLIRFSSLGDVTLTLKCVDWLVEAGCEVHFLTKDLFRPLLETHGRIDRIHTIPNHATLSELMRKTRELRAHEFTEVRDLHRNLRSRVVTFILKAPLRRISKHRLKELALFVLRRGLCARLFAPLNRSREALEVVSGVPGDRPPGRLSSLPAIPVEVTAQLASSAAGGAGGERGALVCIAAESAWRQKEWPTGRFAAVARELVRRGHRVALLGVAETPPELRGLEGVVDLSRKLELPQAAAVLARAAALVSNDSGLMHVAEAVGTPVVAVFGPTSRELGFGPQLPRSRVVEARMWCRPCSKTGRLCIRPIARRKCLTEVRVENVVDAVDKVLRMGATPSR